MRSVWFYIVVFVVAVGVPGWAAYFVGQRYQDPKVFYYCIVAAVLFVGSALVFSYIRQRWSEK